MGKANWFLEQFFYDSFYKNKFVVYVEKSNNKIEKHYYDVDKEGRVLIYKSTDDNFEKNPFISGSIIHFDEKHNAPILIWRDGENVAKPFAFEFGNFSEQKFDSQHDFRLVNLGKRLQELNNPILKSNTTQNYIIWIVLGSLILGLINALMVYQLAQHLGINLLS